ncbi:hypothetical protein B0H13DRAFT_1910371 [Mycena leptocephala]|nr:hypothetical protein B0H13DRAFT_1910371 [Mycena leptocephala]
MTNFPTEPPTARQELVALLATADKLAERASSLNRTARKIQDRLPDILDKLDAEAAADRVFVRGVAKSPATVTAEHADALDGFAPGGWSTSAVSLASTQREQANAQTKGLPNQQCRKKTSKSEALLFYQQKWGENEVRKWNEVSEDD